MDFTNDSGPRDIWVDFIDVAGQVIQAEDASVDYDKGAGETAFGCL